MRSQTAPSTPAQSNGIRVVTSTRSINTSQIMSPSHNNASSHSINQSTSQSVNQSNSTSGDHSGMGSTNQPNSRFWSAVSNTVKFLSNLALDDDLSPTDSTDPSVNQLADQSINQSADQSVSQPIHRTGRINRSKSHSGASTGRSSTLESPTNEVSQSFNQSALSPASQSINRSQSSIDVSAIDSVNQSDSIKTDFITPNTSNSPIGRSINQSTSQSSNPSPKQSTNKSTTLPINQSPNQSSNQSSLDRLLEADNVDLSKLRKVSWHGIPRKHRGKVWKILLGYLPLRKSKRSNLLMKRRFEYVEMIKNDYLPVEQAMKLNQSINQSINSSINQSIHIDETSRAIINQIKQDVPRTSPANPFFKQPVIQQSLTRILFLFALRHPASGYVQGINDLLTPFYATFFDELAMEKPEIITKRCDDQPIVDHEGETSLNDQLTEQSNNQSINQSNNPSNNQSISLDSVEPCPLPLECSISESDLLCLESDCYWCLSFFLDQIQDHYTFAQPGIQSSVFRLQRLTEVFMPELASHFERQNVDFMHFSFRWMNCLLMREMSIECTIRLWDSYLSIEPGQSINQSSLLSVNQSNIQTNSHSALLSNSQSINPSINQSLNQSLDSRGGFGQFHVYVCLAFLLYFAPKLKQFEFQDLIMFLQRLPTKNWKMTDMDSLIAQAFVYQNTE